VLKAAPFVVQHPMSGRAWSGLAAAFQEEGCVPDALLAAEMAHRLYRACGCREGEEIKEMERATGTLKDDAMAAMMLNRSAVACCGAAPQLERGGQTTMLIGGGYAHPSLEEARLEAGNGCPRYFAQCEQGVAQCIHSAAATPLSDGAG
jgi:hypothetical protein